MVYLCFGPESSKNNTALDNVPCRNKDEANPAAAQGMPLDQTIPTWKLNEEELLAALLRFKDSPHYESSQRGRIFEALRLPLSSFL